MDHATATAKGTGGQQLPINGRAQRRQTLCRGLAALLQYPTPELMRFIHQLSDLIKTVSAPY